MLLPAPRSFQSESTGDKTDWDGGGQNMKRKEAGGGMPGAGVGADAPSTLCVREDQPLLIQGLVVPNGKQDELPVFE